MNKKEVEDFFGSLNGKLLKEVSLKNYTWFKVGGLADYLYIPNNLQDLIYFLKNKPEDIKITILGAGSNVLIREGGIRGVVLKLSNFNNIEILENISLDSKSVQSGINSNKIAVKVAAGLLNSALSIKLREHSIGGLEFLSGIPGTIGGGIAMNAGCFGKEFKDVIKEVTALSYKGDVYKFKNEDFAFSYRKNNLGADVIFIEALLLAEKKEQNLIDLELQSIKELRESNQPRKVLTGGSTFANPFNKNNYKAWQLIDMVGLRGFRIGGACYSEKHCNFIINDQNAKAKDIENLIEEAIKRVKDKFDIDLHPEIKILGEETIMGNNK